MNRDLLPYPPQMRNGGSQPAHLSLSSLSNPSAWLQYKWSQPLLHAPDWVRNAPDNRIGCALRKDQQAAGLLPPKSPGGPILLGACACAERAYQDWKWAVSKLWEHKRHHLQMAARQRLLDERAAHECQEAARRQRLLNEETACRQRLLDKEATRRLMAECAALAQQMAAARTIFLWLCRRRLHVRLARQTLQ
jgi:hypothetical protein